MPLQSSGLGRTEPTEDWRLEETVIASVAVSLPMVAPLPFLLCLAFL
jgi:hypothetical protein